MDPLSDSRRGAKGPGSAGSSSPRGAADPPSAIDNESAVWSDPCASSSTVPDTSPLGGSSTRILMGSTEGTPVSSALGVDPVLQRGRNVERQGRKGNEIHYIFRPDEAMSYHITVT